MAREEKQITSPYLSTWSIKHIGFVIITYEVTVAYRLSEDD